MKREKMPDRYFEDFEIGEEWVYPAWTLDHHELVEFAKRYDPQPMHTDPVGALDGPYGGLIASGWQTALHCIQPFLEEVMKHTAGLASPGFETFQWLKPVRPEEPVTPMIKVLDSRRSKSKPNLGLVRFEFSGADSAGDTVWRADGTFFISTRNSV